MKNRFFIIIVFGFDGQIIGQTLNSIQFNSIRFQLMRVMIKNIDRFYGNFTSRLN